MPKIPKHGRSRQRVRRPKTLAQFDALPRRSQATCENVAHAVARIREGVSLKSAAAEFGIAPRTVVRLGGSALRKNASGRYEAKASDTLFRPLLVPVHGGRIEVGVTGSRAASASFQSVRTRRDASSVPATTRKIRKLQGIRVLDASGREIPFLTDLDELERLGDLGVLSFESIYARRG